MKNMLLIMLLVLQPLVFANQCYFQSRRTSYDSGTSIKKISCQWLAQALQNIEFYNRGDNYAPYYERKFGKEGNLIEEVDGRIYMTKFYYALGALLFDKRKTKKEHLLVERVLLETRVMGKYIKQ